MYIYNNYQFSIKSFFTCEEWSILPYFESATHYSIPPYLASITRIVREDESLPFCLAVVFMDGHILYTQTG